MTRWRPSLTRACDLPACTPPQLFCPQRPPPCCQRVVCAWCCKSPQCWRVCVSSWCVPNFDDAPAQQLTHVCVCGDTSMYAWTCAHDAGVVDQLLTCSQSQQPVPVLHLHRCHCRHRQRARQPRSDASGSGGLVRPCPGCVMFGVQSELSKCPTTQPTTLSLGAVRA